MSNCLIVTNLGGFIFIAFSILSAAYWTEATRWEDLLGSDNSDITSFQKNRNAAELIFRLCTGGAIFTLLLIIFTLFTINDKIALVCKYLLIIPLFGIISMGIRYILGKYIVPIKKDTDKNNKRK